MALVDITNQQYLNGDDSYDKLLKKEAKMRDRFLDGNAHFVQFTLDTSGGVKKLDCVLIPLKLIYPEITGEINKLTNRSVQI